MAPMHTATMGGLHHRTSLGESLETGALIGQYAGLVMGAVLMFYFSMFLGKSPLFPVQVIGSVLYGNEALRGFHFPAALSGLILHQWGLSLFWGLMMGFLAWLFQVEGMGLMVLGLTLGVVAQILDVHMVLPVLFKVMQGRDIWTEQVPMPLSWTAHIAYGLMLGLFGQMEKIVPHKA